MRRSGTIRSNIPNGGTGASRRGERGVEKAGGESAGISLEFDRRMLGDRLNRKRRDYRAKKRARREDKQQKMG